MSNYSLSILDNCKRGLIETIESYSTNGEFDYNWRLSNVEYQEARKILMKIYDEMQEGMHEAITKCRDVEEFIQHFNGRAYFGNYDYRDVRLEISEMFNPAMDYIEDKNIEVKLIYIKCDVPKELKYTHIADNIIKCEKRIENGDYAGALTSARSLIEGVCKEILFNITNEEINDKPDLPKLFDKVRKHLNLDPSNPELQKSLKGVISGLIKVVQGLNEIRNNGGDSHMPKYNVSLHHALLAVNSAKTVASFLFHTYEYQREKGRIVASL